MRRLSDIVLDDKPLILSDVVSIAEASRWMHESRAGSVLVTNDMGRLIGIFTSRDALHRVLAKDRDASATSLGDVMTKDPVTLSPEKSAIDALQLMWDGGFRHVPVVDGNHILGIASRGDFRGEELQRLDDERELWEHLR